MCLCMSLTHQGAPAALGSKATLPKPPIAATAPEPQPVPSPKMADDQT